jgi:hypothetical protein
MIWRPKLAERSRKPRGGQGGAGVAEAAEIGDNRPVIRSGSKKAETI